MHRLTGARARQTDHQGYLEQRKIEGRQEDVLEPFPGKQARLDSQELRGWAASGRWKPAEHHRENHDQHQAHPECRQGEA